MIRIAIGHAALLVVPVVMIGRGDALLRPQAIAIVVAMLAFATIEARARRRSEALRFGAPGTRLALATGLALLVTAWLALASRAHPEWAWLGLPLAGTGIALRAAAIRALGDAFSSETVVAPGRRIETRGPYAVVRHPSELGLVAIAAGIAISGASVAAAAMVIAAIVPMSIVRIRSENAALASASPRC